MNKKKLLTHIISNQKNIKYNDFVTLIKAFGFELDRSNGSHNIYFNSEINKQINIQNIKGEAKPYQIKQFLKLVESNNLRLNSEEEESENA